MLLMFSGLKKEHNSCSKINCYITVKFTNITSTGKEVPVIDSHPLEQCMCGIKISTTNKKSFKWSRLFGQYHMSTLKLVRDKIALVLNAKV